MRRRAQTTVEYMLVASVLVVAIVIISYLFDMRVSSAMTWFAQMAARTYTDGSLADGAGS